MSGKLEMTITVDVSQARKQLKRLQQILKLNKMNSKNYKHIHFLTENVKLINHICAVDDETSKKVFKTIDSKDCLYNFKPVIFDVCSN